MNVEYQKLELKTISVINVTTWTSSSASTTSPADENHQEELGGVSYEEEVEEMRMRVGIKNGQKKWKHFEKD